jgi:hypothetical protein
MSCRGYVLYGSQPAGDLEAGSGIGPAIQTVEPVLDPWPVRNYLKFGVPPSAVACARLHAGNLLWERVLDGLASDGELLVADSLNLQIHAWLSG